MKTPMRTSLVLFGGAATLVLAVGGGIAAAGTTTAAGATNPSVTVAPAAPAAPARAAEPNAGQPAATGVHIANLVGCIAGLNC